MQQWKWVWALRGGAEALQEGHCAEARTGRCARTGEPQTVLDGAQEDAQHGVESRRVAVEEEAQALGEGHDPLAHGDLREHMINQVGSGLGHAPGGAGGTDAASLAGEGHEKLVAAVGTAGAGEAVGENPAFEVLAQLVLHVGWYRLAVRVGLARAREPGLEVVLDDAVENGTFGTAAAIHRCRSGAC